MIRIDRHRFGAIRPFLLVSLFTIGLVASATIPAFAQTSGTWKKTGNMKNARDAAPATLLQNGEVLLTGGDGSNGLLTGAELYNPADGQWTATAVTATRVAALPMAR